MPFMAPFAALLVAYLGLIQPRLSARRTAATEIERLEGRLVTTRALLAAPLPKAMGNALHDFELRTPAADRVPALLEKLSRLALAPSEHGEVHHLLIETGDRGMLSAPGTQGGPKVAGTPADYSDPRFALFGAALAYTPVTVGFDASYGRLGRFLWDLRDLPTTVEIRWLEVARPSAEVPYVRVTLLLFAYQRAGPSTHGQLAPPHGRDRLLLTLSACRSWGSLT